MLVIDQGNSLTKVMVYDGMRLTDYKRIEDHDPDAVLALAERSGAKAGIYCGVGMTDVQLIESLRLLLEDDFMVMTHTTPVPVKVCYRPDNAIGLDRIAALAGAWDPGMRSPLLVADAGTAITADLLLPSGEFGGGSIAPGIRMRLAALHAKTARLPEIELREDPSPVCGDSTRESMLSGCVWGAAMELLGRFDYLRQTVGASGIMLAGGDALVLANRLRTIHPSLPLQVVGDLVGLGLVKIYHYNASLRQSSL